MKVFISWSGDLSRELGEALRQWLPGALQFVKPFFTPNDIEKGARWGKEISTELEESSVGIFCLTKENLSKPWIMFEAGALSKRLDASRVCPILFGIDSTDLEGPLVQFQASSFNRQDVKKLFKTINNAAGDNKLDDTVLESVFDMWWPKLDASIKSILTNHSNNTHEVTLRSDREIIEEILSLTRLSTTSTHSAARRILHSSISPKAIQEILDTINSTLDSLTINQDCSYIADDLAYLSRPIEHIIQNLNYDSSIKEDLLSRLEDFKIKARQFD